MCEFSKACANLHGRERTLTRPCERISFIFKQVSRFIQRSPCVVPNQMRQRKARGTRSAIARGILNRTHLRLHLLAARFCNSSFKRAFGASTAPIVGK